jgi:L-threonate 2-dehydrogenase
VTVGVQGAEASVAGVGDMIGLIGVGAMGLAMAQRLRDTGQAVMVRDIDGSRETLALGAGCAVARTPAELALHCHTVIVAVVDGAQMHDVLFGEEGAAAALQPGATVVLCPTVAPHDTEAAATRLLTLQLQVLDAPMSGGPQRAREGRMSLMVAGVARTVQAQLPLLQTLAEHVFIISEQVGDGARTKLVNNLLAASNLAAAAEAMALARQLGLNPHTTLSVLTQSSGQSWIGSDRLTRALAGDTQVLARTALLAKDSALALGLASGLTSGCAGAEQPLPLPLPLPVSRAAAQAFQTAVQSGHADVDDACLLVLAQQRLAGTGP